MAGRKLGRKTNHRKAMWRNMAASLFTHEQITTTVPKAKSLKPFVERLISSARKGDLASRRRVIAALGGDHIMVPHEDDESLVRSNSRPNRPGGYQGKLLGGPRLVKHLFDEIAPRYADRNGGYTRIIKLDKHRIGDGSDLCVLQLVGTGSERGPQVGGQYSRRREQANHRMEIAAGLRKAKAGAATPVAVSSSESDAPPSHEHLGQHPDVSDTVEGARDHVATPGDESGGPV